MFSGGLDSTGVLYRLLTADEFMDFDVHVHHMHVVNRENRAPAEGEAVFKLLRLFRGADMYRGFQTTESLHRYDFMRKDMIWDMDLTAFMAGNICSADPLIQHVAMGRTKTDIESGGEKFLQRMERAQVIFKGVLSLEDTDASYIFPVLEMSKQDVWDMLPSAIREATWSCRTPIYDEQKTPSPCGQCMTCLEVAKLSKM